MKKQTTSNQAYDNSIAGFTETKRLGFTGKIGFVLAASGSAVGLGNLWRFPYLVAQKGGGIFVLCYIYASNSSNAQ